MSTPDPTPIRVRMAPSPTGPLHIGTARTSLYNFLFAGTSAAPTSCASRTPMSRAAPMSASSDIIDNLHWLGITWDEGPQVAGGDDIGPYAPYRQSQRMELYAREADRLLASGAAYHCYCTPEELEAVRHEQERNHEAPRYNGRCLRLTDADRAAFEAEGRQPALRLKVPPEKIRFDDLIRGEVEFDNALLGDFVIVRGNGMPLYHFVVVVDDEAMAITHVVRGEDHLSNTPKHIALIRALGYREPKFGHIPLILNPDRSKMSKRKSQTAITAYREQGYLPEAMVNFLAFLGWSPGTEEEIFSLAELAERFEIGEVHKAGAVFDKDRLDYLNGVYIRSLADGQLALPAAPVPAGGARRRHPDAPGAAPQGAARAAGRCHRAGRLPDRDRCRGRRAVRAGAAAAEGPISGGDGRRRCSSPAMRWPRSTTPTSPPASWRRSAAPRPRRHGWKAGDFFRPLRVAITGRLVSPPLFGSMELLGRERTLARIDAALARLGG